MEYSLRALANFVHEILIRNRTQHKLDSLLLHKGRIILGTNNNPDTDTLIKQSFYYLHTEKTRSTSHDINTFRDARHLWSKLKVC
jgi:hypothetical protein